MMAIIVLFIILGVVLMISSIFGCIASLVESKRLLVAYYVAALSILLTVVICAVLGYTYKGRLSTNLREDLAKSVSLYDPDKTEDTITKAWDTMQKQLECCGVMSNTVDAGINGTQKNVSKGHV